MRFTTYKIKTIFILVITLFLIPQLCDLATAKSGETAKPRNVIFLIADGCGSEQYTLARWFKGAPLSLDEILVGGVKTYIADSVVADSAPTATAYATGFRTSDKFIGIGPKQDTLSVVPSPPEEMRYKPLATVLEGAKLKGVATGIVSTSRVTHATPAAYIAHVPSRSMEDAIMRQAVYQNIDMVMGGGKHYLFPKNAGGKRTDGEDLRAVLRNRGYILAENSADMAAFVTGKLFGMFADSHMEAEIDRQEFAPQQPSLEEMTAKAIEVLSKKSNKKGFFLMVEASEIDWANHANDPSHLISDLLQFDKAVKVALDFAKRDGNTLVIALSDHNTGGMSIGNYATSKTYSQMTVEQLINPIKKMKLSAPGLWKKIGNEKTPEKVKSVVKTYWGMDITDEEAKEILPVTRRDPDDPHNGFGEVLSAKYTAIGWSTHGHTGGDIPLFAYGPLSPKGLIDGPQIGTITARAMGIDLNKVNTRLFVDAKAAFTDGRLLIDKSDAENIVVRIEYQNRKAEMPAGKNILRINGTEHLLEGVVVYIADTDKAYIPMQAVNIIKGKQDALPSVTP